jgi:membrane-associated protease RseP (regulator of RpoE activity)
MPFLGLVQGDEPEEPGQGAPVGGIVENSPAAVAGILPGDLVTEAEGQKIRGWGGLEEIIPVLVPGKPVAFVIRRGEEDIEIEITPEAVPLAAITGTGGLHSTCYFSLDRGMPVKVDLVSRDLVFTLTNASGMSEERKAELHLTLEMKFSGDTE